MSIYSPFVHAKICKYEVNNSMANGLQPYTVYSKYTYTPCLRKNCGKLFLSELYQMFVNFNNFWQVDEKMAKILCHINIFHLTSLMSSQYLVKQKSAKFFNNA